MCTPKENHTCNGCMCRVHQKLMNDFRLTNGKPETDCTKFFFFSSSFIQIHTFIHWLLLLLMGFFFSFVFLLLCFCRAFIVYNKTTKLTENYKKKMCVWLRRLALNFTHLTLYVQIPCCYVFQLAFKYYS